MPRADKEAFNAYQRAYMRKRRAEQAGKALDPDPMDLYRVGEGEITGITAPSGVPLTAEMVRDILADTLLRIKAKHGDTLAGARVVGYLAGVALKAVEMTTIEERVTALERRAEEEEGYATGKRYGRAV